MSHYVHHLPGRLRVKTAILKRNEPEAARLRNLLATLDGVRAHEVNIVTGSILITYNATLTDVKTILDVLKGHGFIEGLIALGHHHDLPARVSSKVGPEIGSNMGRAFGTVGKAFFGFVVEKAVERSAMALLSAVL